VTPSLAVLSDHESSPSLNPIVKCSMLSPRASKNLSRSSTSDPSSFVNESERKVSDDFVERIQLNSGVRGLVYPSMRNDLSETEVVGSKEEWVTGMGDGGRVIPIWTES